MIEQNIHHQNKYLVLLGELDMEILLQIKELQQQLKQMEHYGHGDIMLMVDWVKIIENTIHHQFK